MIADISDRAAVGEPAGAADVVFNLAGQVSHVDSMADPQFDLEVNARSQLGFLDLLRSVNPEAVVVFTSTRQIFGHPHYLPVDEEHPVSPVDVNGITKWAAEQFHMLYHDVYGLRSTSLRLTNVYGPRQRLRDNFQGFLPIFVRLAIEDETITVFGDGSQERDCLYVDDVVECLLRAGATDDAAGEFFNIGNDERLSFREIADAVVVAAGSGRVELGPWPRDRDAIDIGSYYGDSSKAKRMLGWSPSTDVRRRHREDRRVLRAAPFLVPVSAELTRSRRVVDLGRRMAALQPELGEAIDRVVRSGVYLLGPETEAFEAELAAYCGRRHAVAVASGTEALRLSLLALGVGPGDEVDRARVHGRADGGRGVRDGRSARPRRRRTADGRRARPRRSRPAR